MIFIYPMLLIFCAFPVLAVRFECELNKRVNLNCVDSIFFLLLFLFNLLPLLFERLEREKRLFFPIQIPFYLPLCVCLFVSQSYKNVIECVFGMPFNENERVFIFWSNWMGIMNGRRLGSCNVFLLLLCTQWSAVARSRIRDDRILKKQISFKQKSSAIMLVRAHWYLLITGVRVEMYRSQKPSAIKLLFAFH